MLNAGLPLGRALRLAKNSSAIHANHQLAAARAWLAAARQLFERAHAILQSDAEQAEQLFLQCAHHLRGGGGWPSGPWMSVRQVLLAMSLTQLGRLAEGRVLTPSKTSLAKQEAQASADSYYRSSVQAWPAQAEAHYWISQQLLAKGEVNAAENALRAAVFGPEQDGDGAEQSSQEEGHAAESEAVDGKDSLWATGSAALEVDLSAIDRVLLDEQHDCAHIAQYSLALLLASTDSESAQNEASALAQSLGFQFRLARQVLCCSSTPTTGSEQPKAKKRRMRRSNNRGQADGLVHVVDEAVAPTLLAELRRSFSDDAAFWSAHRYGEPETGYFSYCYPLSREPRNVVEQYIASALTAQIQAHFPVRVNWCNEFINHLSGSMLTEELPTESVHTGWLMVLSVFARHIIVYARIGGSECWLSR